MALNSSIENSILAVRKAQRKLQQLSTTQKNKVLLVLADLLIENQSKVLLANQNDLTALPKETSEAFRDRLQLNPERINAIAEGLKQVASLPDPVGELVEEKTLPNQLYLKKVRAPLGLIFMIFESRPNVILEVFSLAFKSGNSIVLRGGSDSKQTGNQLYSLITQALNQAGVSFPVHYAVEDYDRALVPELLKRNDLIDVVIPRGGDKLIALVQEHARMPIIKNDRGLCHTYVAEDADLEMAVRIVTNAKIQRPGVCNSLETVLVHEKISAKFIMGLYQSTSKFKLQWHVDERAWKILNGQPQVVRATEQDWGTEYLSLIMNCKVVSDLDDALEHIAKYGSKHSEAIVTSEANKARRFQAEVDAAAVYWNASTRFTDGFEFGLGGEIGISTQKLHVRGPVGLRELTTPRWIIDGTGQVR